MNKSPSSPLPPARPAPRRFLSSIEPLEDRIAPANNVLTSFIGGTLTITTVDLFDEAAILTGDNNQNFQIIGTAPGSVSVHMSGATTINGGAADANFTGVTNIVVDLKEGNDFLVCKHVDIPGDFTFKGGDGGNSLQFDGDAAASHFRNITFTNGNGVDNFAFLDGSPTLTGKLTINTGEGGSNLNIGFNSTDDVTIAGGISITCGAGGDNINFSGSDLSVNGPVTIKGGSGDNGVRFNYLDSVVFTKPFSFTSGTGNSVFDVGNSNNKSSSFAGITITNGIGNNRVTFQSKTSDTINGNLVITNGAGDDTFNVDSVNFSVTGFVKIKNGAGNSTTDITPTTNNTIGGDFTLSNAAGTDTTSIGGTTVSYKGVKITNGTGNTTTTLTGTDLSFASISSTSGDGADTFTVTATNKFEILTGGLTLKNGVGGSTTSIGATNTASIAGLLSITNGEGLDTQIIGNGAGNFSGLHSVTISNGAGGSTTTFNPVQLTITGSVMVTSGEGFDTFRLGNGALTTFGITGSLKLSHGLGGSTTQFNPTTSGVVTGAFTVTSADGNDTVDLIRTTIGGATTLMLGAGNDTVEIDNSTIAALKILTGSGNDQVKIENTTNDGIGTTVGGIVSLDLGIGADSIAWGIDGNDFVTANQRVKLNGGANLDSFDQSAATNSFIAGSPSVIGIEVQLP